MDLFILLNAHLHFTMRLLNLLLQFALFENLEVRLIFPVENRAALCDSQTETLRQSLFRKPMGRSAPRSFLRGLAGAQLAKKIRNVTRSHYF